MLAQIVAIGVHSPQTAFASATISLPTTLSAGTSFTNVNSAGALSISGYSAGDTVQVTIGVDRGFVKISTTTGLTAPAGYTSAQWTANTSIEIAFFGSEANVSSALNSLQYQASGANVPATIRVTSFLQGGAFNSATGTFYEIVNNGSAIAWELARCKALYSNSDVSFSGTSLLNSNGCSSSTTLTRRVKDGLRGYLANITSLAEHEFIRTKSTGVGWIGGTDSDVEGTFIWMDGPEKGQVFWTGSGTRRTTNTVTGSSTAASGPQGSTQLSYGADRFNYWSDGEPNNASNEDFAEFGFGSAGVGSSWNDCRNGCNRSSYIIEYGDTGDTLSGASGAINVNPRVVVSTETDTALFFNESSAAGQHARLDSSTALGTFNAISLQMWVKPLAGSACAGNLLSKANNFALYCVSGGTLAYALSGAGAWVGVSTGIPIPAGSWSHIALTRIASTTTNGVKIYLNGQHVYTGTADGAGTSPIGNSNTTFLNFAGRNNSGDFRGSIDEVKIWREDRSASIATDMTSNATSTANLVGYWNFNEGTGTKIFNQVSTATYLTDLDFSGTPRWEPVAVSSTSGPYSVVTFPRTIITSSGGWRASETRTVSTLIVGGGGGGGWNSGGGGGGGGFLQVNSTQISGVITVRVGVGGRGGQGADASGVPTYTPANGEASQFGSNTVSGGNKGGVFGSVPLGGTSGGLAITTASGNSGAGGNGTSSNGVRASDGSTGLTSTFSGSSVIYSSGGGGGGWNSVGGTAGSGAGDGGGSSTQTTGISATANRGGGGGASAARVNAGNGGSGIIIIRWITASTPAFTAPVAVDTTTAGTRYTFRVSGSATSPLIRNYQWQFSSNSGSSWTTQQASTSDSFTTTTLETTTSGITNLYRVIVTDSDTAGLSISDSRTSYLVINPRITITVDTSTITRDYGVATVKTFTFANGTGPRVATASPGNQSGITWSNLNSDSATLTLAPTLTAGSYSDTITVTDSVTATTSLTLTITINKARQASLSIGQYNAFVSMSSYPINVYGGSSSGAVTRSLDAPGSAGCEIDSSSLVRAARVGTCSVTAVKAGDTNYLSETATATIYWIQWSDAYATRAPSTPTEIVLNHSTAITKYNYDTLTVTSYQNSSGVTITSIATGATLRIIGDGFDPTSAYTEVVFASMDALDLTTGLQVISSGGSNYLQLTVPSGVTTGAITVNSPKGTAVGPVLTITP